METERRIHERYKMQLPVIVQMLPEENGNETLQLHTTDISSGGAFLCTDTPLPLGSEVELEVYLPFSNISNTERTDTVIQSKGSVIRTEHTGMAIEFIRISRITSYNATRN